MKFLFTIVLVLLSTSQGLCEPIKVGAIFPLTGTVAPWGERLRVGLDTANELHGNQFTIAYEDEGPCDGQKALTAYRKLVNFDGVKIIFLGCLSGAETIAPVAAKDSVLLLSLGLLNEFTLNSGAKMIDLATEIGTEGKYLAKYIDQEQPKKIAGLFFADSFGAEFSRVLSKHLTARGRSFIALDDAPAQAQTFNPVILRWKKLGVDLLVTSLSDQQQMILLKELDRLAFRPKIFSTYALESYAPPVAERKIFEGIKYTHPVNSAEASPRTRKLEAELAKRERPGQSSNINALFAYDGMGFLKEGIAHCKGVEPECLYKYYTTLGPRDGVSGQMRFEASGALARPYGLKIVKGGEFIWIERAKLESGG